MSRDPDLYFKHILDAITRIEAFIKDTDQERFFQETMVQSAVIKELEIIGEAVK